LGALMHAANPTVGLAAHTGQVDIRIAARAETASEAERLLDEVEAQVRAAVGRYIYSTTPGESYEAVLAPQLAAAGLTLAILETNTQGLLAQRLDAALPGGRLVLLALAAGATSLPNELERLSDYHALPVEQMAALAEDAAVHVRAEGKAVLGVALVGTAGADEGIYGRQSGATWLAIAGPAGPYSERIPFGGQDEYTLVRITNQVLRRLAKQLETQEVGGE
ncbi:MAG: CinA family protein, partial [Caldilineaceae bacterium]|nr:CinA family protein [Caldilineaceae bacterium]